LPLLFFEGAKMGKDQLLIENLVPSNDVMVCESYEPETNIVSGDRGGSTVRTVGLVAFGLLGIAVVVDRLGIIKFNFPDGGKSAPAPTGTVIYEGQTARTAVEDFMFKVGNGEATVSVKAKQNWDKPGTWLNGDFQSTNGTAFVDDPTDGSKPAALKVSVDYCSTGTISKTFVKDSQTGQETLDSVTMDMGDLVVCDSHLLHTPDNDASFTQDDTPDWFQGDFDSFIAHAVETDVKAAPCPTDELNKYLTPEVVTYDQNLLAAKFRLAFNKVKVNLGKIGKTSPETQELLRVELNDFANKKDPYNPDKTYEALDIEYLNGNKQAITDSCYKNAGGLDLGSIEEYNAQHSQPTPPVPDAAQQGAGK